ncbi:MAG TPA: 4-alpha-glucanotransferase, partial [Acidimicrobiales bacterium]|nr:4-alpha-glucanotransferase [Acidimicrobiales bacterium]
MPEPERWGIDRGYHDAAGGWHDVPGPTVEAFLTAMDAHDDGPPAAPALFTVPGRESPRVGPGWLGLEDGTTLDVDGALPPDLPFGYHRFVPRGGDERHATRVIAGPGRCHLPDHRMWGWAVQLYATRSRASWGIGDLADLRRVAAWSAGLGAGMALVSPLHAALPGHPQQPSPYFPSSRCFRNPLYLRVEDVPGAGGVPEVDAAAAAGRALNQERRIDRDAVWRLKSAALETLFAAFGGDADFDRFAAEGGDALRGYATFCALVELHGSHWGTWPPAVRRPDGAGVAALATSGAVADRIRYHSWLQWLLDL